MGSKLWLLLLTLSMASSWASAGTILILSPGPGERDCSRIVDLKVTTCKALDAMESQWYVKARRRDISWVELVDRFYGERDSSFPNMRDDDVTTEVRAYQRELAELMDAKKITERNWTSLLREHPAQQQYQQRMQQQYQQQVQQEQQYQQQVQQQKQYQQQVQQQQQLQVNQEKLRRQQEIDMMQLQADQARLEQQQQMYQRNMEQQQWRQKQQLEQQRMEQQRMQQEMQLQQMQQRQQQWQQQR